MEAVTDPQEVRVLIPVRMSWRARDQLRKIAENTGRSMNQTVIDALEAVLDWQA